MITLGDLLPTFSAADSEGGRVESPHWLGRPGILFFYPRADSLGCSREARGFAERFEEVERLGARLVGVSVDAAEAQRAFALRCRLPFPLLTDVRGDLARRFGVLGSFGIARRVTFVYDSEARIRRVVDRHLPSAHPREALAALEDLARGRPQD